jgi:glycosyltransferase involved in cell wall biosynthesis
LGKNVLKNLVVIGTVWPEPDSSAAGGRILTIIREFQAFGYKIYFASIAQISDFMADLTYLDIEQVSIKLNDSSFNHWIESIQPEIVLFDRFMSEEQFGWRVSESCPNAIKILDTEDLHCLRKSRQLALKKKETFELHHLDNDWTKREIASIYRCDLSLIISSFEMDLLTTYFKIPAHLIHYLPFTCNPNLELNEFDLPYEKRKDFVFIGNFYHEPNWDAVKFLKEEIWPRLKTLVPEAFLQIYGAYPSEKVFQLHQVKDRFIINGRAKNAKEVLSQARISLAPLRFGAGLKGKILESMEVRTPTVTTEIGAEGMSLGLPWGGIITNDSKQFIKACADLYNNPKEWKNAQVHGDEILKKNFQTYTHIPLFKSKILDLIQNYQTYRKQNFIGNMLTYHTVASSKYMSKWIEEKNKLNG